jgi:hypothetical protein
MYADFKPSELTPAVRLAFEARGIIAHGNALKPGHTVQHVECFMMADGSVVKADGRIVAAVAREAINTERAQRAYVGRV